VDTDKLEDQLLTIRDFVRYGISQFNQHELFFGHGTDNALDEVSAIILFALNLPSDIPGHFMDARVVSTEKKTILELFQQRIEKRIPASYLTNEAWFAGLSFYVDDRVLVPRSPIAELINNKFQPWVDVTRLANILDLCTGSACIAIACAHQFPDAEIDAVDISKDALDVARINIDEYALQDQVYLLESNLFAALDGKKYDLIVSNPPYVDAQELSAMPQEFHHEPEIGLGSGSDGLEITKQILHQAADHLTDQGVLIVEVGVSDAALSEQFPDMSFTWLELEHGGQGVFLLRKSDLQQSQHSEL